MVKTIIKRDGRTAEFHPEKIADAVEKSFQACAAMQGRVCMIPHAKQHLLEHFCSCLLHRIGQLMTDFRCKLHLMKGFSHPPADILCRHRSQFPYLRNHIFTLIPGYKFCDFLFHQ